MANEFQISSVIATEGLQFLSENNVLAGPDNIANRSHEGDWSKWDDLEIGTEIRIPVPFYFETLDSFDQVNPTVVSDVKNKTIALKIEEHFYKRISITSEDLAFRSKNFIKRNVKAVMEVFATGIEKFCFRKMFTGTYNYVKLAGVPSSKADLAKINTAFIKMKAKQGEKKLILTTEAHEAVTSMDAFTKANERNSDFTINTGYAGSYYGMEMYVSTILDEVVEEVKASLAGNTFTGGVLKTSVSKDQDVKVLVIDDVEVGEVIKKYTILKVGSVSFVAAADAVEAGGEIQVLVERIGYNASAGAAVSIETGIGYNFAITPYTFLLVQASPAAALGAADSSYAVDTKTGANIRVTIEWSNDNMKTNALFDTFVGGRVGQSEQSYRC